MIGAAPVTPDDPGDGTTEPDTPATDETPEELLARAQTLFDEADAALAAVDFGTYGEKMAEARELVAQAIELLGGAG